MKYPSLTALSAITAAALLIAPVGVSAMCDESNGTSAQLSPTMVVSPGNARASTVGFGGSTNSIRWGNDSQPMAGYGAGESSLPGGNRWSDGMPMVW